jgi:hypothetical protein
MLSCRGIRVSEGERRVGNKRGRRGNKGKERGTRGKKARNDQKYEKCREDHSN